MTSIHCDTDFNININDCDILELCVFLCWILKVSLVGVWLFASVGGEIQSLVWDPRGERLAVLLKGLLSLFEQCCIEFRESIN